ncbi:flagellar motor switch protein FliG [Chelatococcus sp. SYSU_G07232]|uniref:Flagellar motor switch protein FliG n=1 Tax=Chelatococcus albus TaxID=3047466 RepID=A0ABT7AFH0_9HYPH|nr:flagellar motor switch protein FliG [Chelatococcus sp. SYSU_G07232]MDJ1158121.1 flagellar motor switch protein FliG [Chelatococcus sp. SYSU_G07232]
MQALASAQKKSMTLNELSGPQRAAVLLLALGPEHGAEVWRLLEEDELRIISRTMAQLGAVEPEAVENLIVDFAERLSTAAVTGSFDRTEMLLRQTLPAAQARAIMDEIRGPAGRNMWQKLSNVDCELLANYLKNEYPQTVAVILSKIKPENAARVLTILPEDYAIDVVNRMLKLDSVQKVALDHIEETLRNEFIASLSRTAQRDSHEMMAEVFNAFDRQTETRFLASLDEINKDAAERIRSLMFTFEDLTKLDPASVQTLMRHIDKDTLARALKGAPEPIREFLMSNMSSRAAKMLQDDMDALGPMRLKDVDEAQMKMVNLARDLADRGEIMITKNSAEDELIY